MNSTLITGEHEFEAVHGLPQALPAGERIVWQGSPDWKLVARDVLHWRALALYFTVLLTWRAADVAADGSGAMAIVGALGMALPLAALALGMVLLLAWLIARTAVYTVTDQRVVMSIGIVLSVSFNLPLSQIAAAHLKLRRDGSGEIALELVDEQRIAWLHLWPHARPWRLKRTQPMLRGLADARRVGAVLAAVKQGGPLPQSPTALDGVAAPVAAGHGFGDLAHGLPRSNQTRTAA